MTDLPLRELSGVKWLINNPVALASNVLTREQVRFVEVLSLVNVALVKCTGPF